MVRETRCVHDKRKSHCKRCSGSQICMHLRRKQECTECARSDANVKVNRNICKQCRGKHLSTRRRQLGLCASCHKPPPPRTEHVFGDLICDFVGFPPNLKDELISNEHCVRLHGSRRPDLVWILPGQCIVVVEIDEDSHYSYPPQREIRKIREQNASLRALHGCSEANIYTIRVNPDTFDGGKVKLTDRAKFVGRLAKRFLRQQQTEHCVDGITFVFYHSKANESVSMQNSVFKSMEFG